MTPCGSCCWACSTKPHSTLGDNRRVDLSQTVIFMTSNLGGGEITELMAGGYGFIKSEDMPVSNLDQRVERTAVEAARRKFSPEFMNRVDKVVVFHPLRSEQLEAVLDIELGLVQKRVSGHRFGQVPIPRYTRRTRFPSDGRNRSTLWRKAPEARH